VDRAFGYKNGKGVGQVIKRLEQERAADEELHSKINQRKSSLSRVDSAEKPAR
jgi:hypothetical protein